MRICVFEIESFAKKVIFNSLALSISFMMLKLRLALPCFKVKLYLDFLKEVSQQLSSIISKVTYPSFYSLSIYGDIQNVNAVAIG